MCQYSFKVANRAISLVVLLLLWASQPFLDTMSQGAIATTSHLTIFNGAVEQGLRQSDLFP